MLRQLACCRTLQRLCRANRHTTPPLPRDADPYCADTGLREDAPLSLVLPQATSSRHAAELLGSLLSRHGAGEAFGGVLMADAR